MSRQQKPLRRQTSRKTRAKLRAFRAQPSLECLEERLVLNGPNATPGAVLPLFASSQNPYGTAQPDLVTAEINGLYQLILGRTPDGTGLSYWSGLIQNRTSPGAVAQALLNSPEYQANLVEQYFQTYLKRSAEPGAISYWTQAMGAATDPTELMVGLTSSTEYQQLYSNNSAFVQSLYQNLLGRAGSAGEITFWSQVLTTGVGRASVATEFVTSPEALTNSIESFYQAFLQRNADPQGLTYWAGQAQNESLSAVAAGIVGSPEFQVVASGGTAGQTYSNFYTFNQQVLAPDPVTDPAASGQPSTSNLAPMDSTWGQAVVFPSVSYVDIQGATPTADSAAQPTLKLPDNLLSQINLNPNGPGGSVEFWFQAKNPGVLLSEDLTTTTNTTYATPLIYINSAGNLVAGLFDETPLSITPEQSPLAWTDPNGQPGIGAPNPLISQVHVVDNTWHHVAFTFTGQTESLYVDGVLEGSSQALYHFTTPAPLTSTSTTLFVNLDKTPLANHLLQGTISEVAQPNSSNHQDFGSAGTVQTYAFQGWIDPSASSDSLRLTSTSAGVNVVQSAQYLAASNQLQLTLLSPVQSANALSVSVAFATSSSAFTLVPNVASAYATPVSSPSGPSTQISFLPPKNLTMGGSIVPEPISKPHPDTNYPQGYIGSLDDVRIWSTAHIQPQVQEAMVAALASPDDSTLIGYFPFTQTEGTDKNEWVNEAPGATTFAQGPSQFTQLVPVTSTIATDPFPDSIQRLPGFRNWGLNITSPLSNSTSVIDAGQALVYKVALAAGDQLQISLDGGSAALQLDIEDDLGRTTSIQIFAGSPEVLAAARTGTYKLTFTWQGSTKSNITFVVVPGPINSVMDLFTSFQQPVAPGITNTVQAYSDPSLAGVLPALQGSTAAGPASYWPLWSDQNYFPTSPTAPYGTADLQQAFVNLNNGLAGLGKGITNFCNLIDSQVVDPTQIQSLLPQAYQAAFATPVPDSGGPTTPFVVQQADNAQDAVYEFLWNANLLRSNLYSVLSSSVPAFIQEVINAIGNNPTQANNPSAIADTIATGQGYQLPKDVPVSVHSNAKQSIAEILEGGGIWAAGGFFASLAGLAGVDGFPLVLAGGLLAGGGASIGQSFLDNSFIKGSAAPSLTVPIASLTNTLLDYELLSNLSSSIADAMTTQWQFIQVGLTKGPLLQSVLSNFGLLLAFSDIGGQALDAITPGDAVWDNLTHTSWQQMTPEVLQWKPVSPSTFPSGNGQTNDWNQSAPYGLAGSIDFASGMTTFHAGNQLGLAIANTETDDVSILSPNGDGTFATAQKVSLNGPDGATGIVAGVFDESNPGWDDLIITDTRDSELSYIPATGPGQFGTAHTISFGHGGPDGSTGIATGVFNNTTKHLDLAIANFGSDDLTVMHGNGDGTFVEQTISLEGAHDASGVAVGDFNGDGNEDIAVSNFSSNDISVVFGNGDGTFQTAQTISLNGQQGANAIVTGDFNGDGDDDIAVINELSDTMSILLFNSPTHSFLPAQVYSMPAGSAFAGGLTLLPIPNALPDLVVSCSNSQNQSSNLNLFINNGSGGFLTPLIIPPQGLGDGFANLVAADFNGNGLNQLAVLNAKNSSVYVYSPASIGNIATFVPGTSTSSNPLTGPTSLDTTVSSSALGNLLNQVELLQGGNTVAMGPFDQTSLVTPGGKTLPEYLAFLSSAYGPDPAPISVSAPGMFLSVTPATLRETGHSDGVDLTYSQNGAYMNGWQLVDNAGDAIAVSTAQQLFGAFGSNLTPANTSQPFAAFNGGWYFNTLPASGAATTYADAFFGWGVGDYSPKNLVPTTSLTGQLPNTATYLISNNNVNFTVSFQGTLDSPPKLGVAVPITNTTYNRLGIAADGATFSGGGLDGAGNAYSAALLGGSVIANGVAFYLGGVGNNNVVTGAGQTIGLPAGTFTTLNLLGTGVNGAQQDLTFTVRYTDDTTQEFTQSMSDWFTLQNFSGQSIAATMAYRDNSGGGQQFGPYYLFAYSFTLAAGKTVASITLPNDGNAIIAAMTLA